MTVLVSVWMLTTKGISVTVHRTFRDNTNYPELNERGQTSPKKMEDYLKEDAPEPMKEFVNTFNKEMYGDTDQSKQGDES